MINMKAVISALLLLSLYSLGFGQTTCLDQGISFGSQQDIDNFNFEYPDCVHVLGDVTINTMEQFGDIVDLEGLSQIIQLKSLNIADNPNLSSLNGLHNISHINGELSIFNNDGLTDLSGLSSLVEVADEIIIEENDSLITLKGMDSLDVTNRLTLSNNLELFSTIGLEGIDTIRTSLNISNNPKLKNVIFNNLKYLGSGMYLNENGFDTLSGFANLEHSKYIFILDNDSIELITGFDKLKSVEILISGNHRLKRIEGFEGVNNITTIACHRNNSLESIEVMNNAKECNNVIIESNPQLLTLSGFQSLRKINGSMTVIYNPLLESITGFESIDTILKTIDIRGNHELNDISAFNGISFVRDLIIRDSKIIELNSFENLDTLNIIELVDNNSLLTLYGLHNVLYVDSILTVINNDVLTDFSGLASIKRINGVFEIRSNDLLQNLNGLDSLQIVESLYILDNPTIRSTTGLENLDSVYVELSVERNRMLDELTFSNLSSVGEDISLWGIAIDTLNNFPLLENAKNISINSCDSLSSIAGFEILHSNNTFSVYNNFKLIDISGVNMLKKANDVFINNNSQLETISGFQELDSIKSFLSISDNAELISTLGFSNLDFVDLLELENSNLIDLSDFANLKSLNTLWLFQNKSLSTLIGLENISKLHILLARENTELSDLNGLNNLLDISRLEITNCPLQNLNTLSNLKSINWDLKLKNTKLTNLNGLDSLSWIGGLELIGNQQLNSISTLNNVQPASLNGSSSSATLEIIDNIDLDLCNLDVVCQWLNDPAVFRECTGNKGQCLNEETIINSCTTLLDELSEDGISFYPNPVKSILHIDNESPIHITILTIHGTPILERDLDIGSQSILVEDLSSGLYIVVLLDPSTGKNNTEFFMKL